MIAEIKVMAGPNRWSRKHSQLVVMKLESPTEWKGDTTKLCTQVVELFPDLEKEIQFIRKQTPSELIPSSLLSLLSIYLQQKSGADVSFSDTVTLGTSSLYTVYEYEQVEHGIEAGTASETILKALLNEG